MRLLQRHLQRTGRRLTDVRRLLDVGAGDGWLSTVLAADLAADATIVAWDVAYTPEDLSAGDPRIHWTRERPTGTFDVVLLLDVLEHIEDPAAFLRDAVVPLLAPDAVVLVSVPAHPRLFSIHDVRLGHHRRYRRRDLLDLLRPHVEVIDDGPLFVSLVPMRAMEVARERRGRVPDVTGVGTWTAPSAVTHAVRWALRVDATLGATLARLRLPVRGLSHWTVARPRAAS